MLSKGNSTGRVIAQADSPLVIDVRDMVSSCQGMDEIALFEEYLPPSMVYQHYLDALSHRPYSPDGPGTAPPPMPPPQKPTWNLQEYPPGVQLPTLPGNATAGVSTSALNQLAKFPEPRYDTASVAANGWSTNFNWMTAVYLGGQGQSGVSRANVTTNALAIMSELANTWQYALVLDGHGCCSDLQNRTISMANANPEWGLDVVIMRIQEHTQLLNKSLPAGCYLQNSAGEFINCQGTKVDDAHKILRPTTPGLAVAEGCPDSVFDRDGEYFRDRVFAPMSRQLTRTITRINEDGEIFVSLGQNGACAADPKVLAAYKQSGAANWVTYASMWRVRLTARFRDLFLHAGLPALANTHYSEYQVQGTTPYFGNWTWTRQINTPYANRGGQHLSTADMYPVHMKWWMSGAGPWHGFSWIDNVRRSEIAAGDRFFSPFIAAGWSVAVERNLRPAMWLGMLKLLGAWGAVRILAAPFQPSAPGEKGRVC